MDPRGGSTELHEVYRSWLASRPDLSAKVRRGYQDNGRLRIEPRYGRWQISKIDHDSIQSWVNDMTTAWLGPRTVRWTHSVLKMTLDYSADAGRLIGRNPASRTKFPPMRPTAHTYLSAAEVATLATVCGDQGDVVLILAYTGLRFGELTGLNVEDVGLDARRVRVRRSMTQVGGCVVEGNPKSTAGRRSVPIAERLVPLFKARINRRPHGAPAAASPRGSRLGLENWKRSVRWRSAVTAIGREKVRVHVCDTPTPRYPGGPAPTLPAPESDGPRLRHRHRTHLRRPLRRAGRYRRGARLSTRLLGKGSLAAADGSRRRIGNRMVAPELMWCQTAPESCPGQEGIRDNEPHGTREPHLRRRERRPTAGHSPRRPHLGRARSIWRGWCACGVQASRMCPREAERPLLL